MYARKAHPLRVRHHRARAVAATTDLALLQTEAALRAVATIAAALLREAPHRVQDAAQAVATVAAAAALQARAAAIAAAQAATALVAVAAVQAAVAAEEDNFRAMTKV